MLTSAPIPPPVPTGSRPTILVVEDDRVMADVIREAHLAGKVIATNGTTFTVQAPFGQTYAVTAAAGATYAARQGTGATLAAASASDVTVGRRVTVFGTRNGATFTAVRVVLGPATTTAPGA